MSKIIKDKVRMIVQDTLREYGNNFKNPNIKKALLKYLPELVNTIDVDFTNIYQNLLFSKLPKCITLSLDEECFAESLQKYVEALQSEISKYSEKVNKLTLKNDYLEDENYKLRESIEEIKKEHYRKYIENVEWMQHRMSQFRNTQNSKVIIDAFNNKYKQMGMDVLWSDQVTDQELLSCCFEKLIFSNTDLSLNEMPTDGPCIMKGKEIVSKGWFFVESIE